MISNSSNSNLWFVCPQANPEAEMRLFLFPYAGGGPAVFSKWGSRFSGNIETWIAHYPGRGSRHNEPPIKQIRTLAEKLSEAMHLFVDKPFAFLGHSLGGLVAFELARHLRRKDLPQPEILFISACGAPHMPDPHPPIHALPDTELLQLLQQLKGIPSELFHQSDMMRLLLPSLRADFQAVESYIYIPGESALSCPIVAFGGVDDPRVSRERLEGWSLHTNSDFKSQFFPGDHFFINTVGESVMASITAELTSAHAKI